MEFISMDLKIGQILPKLVRKKNSTYKRISAATGVPASTLSEWGQNRKPRDPTQILKVAQYLDVSLHYLLFGREDNQDTLQKIFKKDLFHGTFEITIKKIQSDEEST